MSKSDYILRDNKALTEMESWIWRRAWAHLAFIFQFWPYFIILIYDKYDILVS